MTKHEKAFNDFVDMCIKLLETEAIEKGIDCEEAKRFVINLNGNLKGSDISEKTHETRLYNLGNAYFNYQNALEATDFTDKLTYLVMGFSSFGELSDGLSYQDFKSERARRNAKHSHEETNEFKEEIIEHYKLNKFTEPQLKTKDLAAGYYRTVYPLKFSTVRKYLKNL